MKVFFDMVGCRLNQAEIEKMGMEFRQAGHNIVANDTEADLVVVNTCSVTHQAASDSRQKIRRYAGNQNQQVIATGCWSTLEPTNARDLGQHVTVIHNQDKDHLVANFLRQQPEITSSHLFDQEPLERSSIAGLRQKTRSFIKVQDGCDNRCTFCVTTIARGRGISMDAKSIINEINAAYTAGSKEVVLTGVHLGSWGQDFAKPQHLANLLDMILSDTDVPRIRLSSLEPWDLNEQFFSRWSDPRLCRHLHLPLQSGSDATLRRMLRKTTRSSFRHLTEQARRYIPGLSITTDLITGFPAESEQEFFETKAFVQEMQFSGGHVFTYSERDGTPAARIRQSVPHPIRKQRNNQLQSVIRLSAEKFKTSQIGQQAEVLWEASNVRTENGWLMSGLTSNYIRVFAHADQYLWNQIDPVQLSGLHAEGMLAEILVSNQKNQ